jgi:hypothetical protein
MARICKETIDIKIATKKITKPSNTTKFESFDQLKKDNFKEKS